MDVLIDDSLCGCGHRRSLHRAADGATLACTVAALRAEVDALCEERQTLVVERDELRAAYHACSVFVEQWKGTPR